MQGACRLFRGDGDLEKRQQLKGRKNQAQVKHQKYSVEAFIQRREALGVLGGRRGCVLPPGSEPGSEALRLWAGDARTEESVLRE